LHCSNEPPTLLSATGEGEILSSNKAAEKLLGYSAAEAVHKTCYDILEGMGALGTRVCHQHCSGYGRTGVLGAAGNTLLCPRCVPGLSTLSRTSLPDFGLLLEAPTRTGKPISAAAGANARFEIKRFTSTNIGSKCRALAESIPPT